MHYQILRCFIFRIKKMNKIQSSLSHYFLRPKIIQNDDDDDGRIFRSNKRRHVGIL